jgi:citrate lyase subunit beta/citryl-CoA lyase
MKNSTNIWPLRSFLFVPAHRSEWIAKAILAKPDAVVLDLEDSVPPDKQAIARSLLAREIAELADHSIAPFVRIREYSAETVDELAAAVHPGLVGIMLPKAKSAEEIRAVHDLLSFHEGRQAMQHGVVAIMPLPETATGLQQAESLASASFRVKGIVGTVSGPTTGDVALAFGFRATMGGVEQYYMNSKLVLDSRAGGAQYPIAGVFGIPMDDLVAVESLLRRAKEFGYTGSPVMHPSHVSIANSVYSPTEEEARYFEGMLQAFSEAELAGKGAVRYGGAMVDYAMLPLARQTVAEFRRRNPESGIDKSTKQTGN